MKQLALWCVLMLTAVNAGAQSLDLSDVQPDVATYYRGCLMLCKGVEQRNLTMVENASDLLHEGDEDHIYITLNDPDITLLAADTVPLGARTRFTCYYADYLAESGFDDKRQYKDVAVGMRSLGGCTITQFALKAGGSVSYQMTMADKCQMFAITEPGGTVGLHISSDEADIELDGTPYERGMSSFAQWYMSEAATVTITIKNTGTQAQSVAVVCN